MSQEVSGITKLRRKVFSKVAKLTLEGKIKEKINDLPKDIIPENGLGYRCCVHKEQAIVNDRIKSALGLNPSQESNDLSAAVETALNLDQAINPVVDILDIACDRCPLDKYRVSDACRNCVDHSCINVCPQDAIVTVQNKAYIDQQKCIECGLCEQACPYNAILELSRPCESACELEAVKANSERQAHIDQDKCVSCGSCIESCPFGAITYKSQIMQTIKMLKTENTIAILAPSFVGQFGPGVKPAQIKQGLEELGFINSYEVALGADIVASEETKELLDKIPGEQDYLTTSCCPSFLSLLEGQFSDLKDNVSSLVSPMVAIAKVLKSKNPNSKVVFIGPCIAKKDEAMNYKEVDAVLTFEELGSIFVGAGINLVNLEEYNNKSLVSDAGRTFGRSGGLVKAVTGAVRELDSTREITTIQAEGLKECIKTLNLAQAGKYSNAFIEGMGCSGGCIGGPGTLMNTKKTKAEINKFGSEAKITESINNNEAQNLIEELGEYELHRN